jgi:hypothetical protein
MNTQTKIIVATAVVLVAIDLLGRAFLPVRGGSVVSAREFRLVDSHGQSRAVLTTDRNGEPGLVMYDNDGQNRLQLDTFQHVPSLLLRDENEARRVYFGMDERTGAGRYQLTDAQGQWSDVSGMNSFTTEVVVDPTIARAEASQDIVDEAQVMAEKDDCLQ